MSECVCTEEQKSSPPRLVDMIIALFMTITAKPILAKREYVYDENIIIHIHHCLILPYASYATQKKCGTEGTKRLTKVEQLTHTTNPTSKSRHLLKRLKKLEANILFNNCRMYCLCLLTSLPP